MKADRFQSLSLLLLFNVLIYFFTRNFYSLFFGIMLVLFLLIAFLSEKNRLFVWAMISFFGSNMILVYLDKFIEGFHFGPFSRVMINQILYIIPILMVSYVIKQFKKEISMFFKKPNPSQIKKFPSIILFLASAGFIIFIYKNNVGMDLKLFSMFILFVLIHSILQEVIWRGILLTQMIKITDERTAILLSTTAFALNTTIFGFSFTVFLMYLFLGVIFALLTINYKSIFPAILAHTLLLLLLFLNGWLRLPI
jgi:uncharacterized protein